MMESFGLKLNPVTVRGRQFCRFEKQASAQSTLRNADSLLLVSIRSL